MNYLRAYCSLATDVMTTALDHKRRTLEESVSNDAPKLSCVLCDVWHVDADGHYFGFDVRNLWSVCYRDHGQI